MINMIPKPQTRKSQLLTRSQGLLLWALQVPRLGLQAENMLWSLQDQINPLEV